MKSIALFIAPSMIQAELSGAKLCKKHHARTVLVYHDDTEAMVKTADLEKLGVNWGDWFSIVNAVKRLSPQRVGHELP